ncbi:MAG: lamin tail domain-containing protein, partial [Phycisphaerae bacterium]|nr:lamin tail domain-containing protein [Phycisphaerae bacterium]
MANQDRHDTILRIFFTAAVLLLAQTCNALVITEIMFHPVEVGATPAGEENLEFIELYNDRAVTEDAAGYAFTNGIGYTFPPGTMIPPKTYIVVAKNPAAVQAAYGITGVYGPFEGALNNDGERITLSGANGDVIISLRYNDGHPWYPAADGTGHSLTRVKLAGDPEEPSSWAPSTFIGGTPGAPDDGPGALGRLSINELLTNSDAGPGLDWIEVYNPGPVAMDLSSVYLSDGRFDLLTKYRFPPGIVLQPGQFITVDQASLGFALSATGETVFLTAATGTPARPLRVLDAVRFGTVEPDVTLGRYPDGDNRIVALSAPTRGLPNARPLQRPIVINEIMYHHGSRDPRYEFVELYNQSASPVSLVGWSFTDGIDYEFPPGTTIAAGGYLAVAADPQLLAAVYDNLTVGVNLFGPYSGGLDNHSERLRLSLPAAEVNPATGKPYPITADEVTWYDGGRWPVWADGMGAGLELRDPSSDNDSPDAWAASDESAKAQWQPFSFTIQAADASYTHDAINMFEIMLLNRGDVLLDDLQLIVDGTNRLTNGGFESGQSPWNFLGNHVQSRVTTDDPRSGSRSLHLKATGHGDPGANRINQSIAQVTAGTVTFSGYAKWLRGSRHLLLRTSRQLSPVQPPRPAYVCELAMPMNLGTPGRRNTAWTPNRGPDINDV